MQVFIFGGRVGVLALLVICVSSDGKLIVIDVKQIMRVICLRSGGCGLVLEFFKLCIVGVFQALCGMFYFPVVQNRSDSLFCIQAFLLAGGIDKGCLDISSRALMGENK
ncbi:hypothetical protein JHL22_09620 [Advenella sp. WQ 585]|uniref:Uncharacterized protein n=1 Tax=Advenella mandrilli TaxID=2800330 RepID=A0ABS1EC59_9BURK|nr:hypothetical protein [Advenella mandrilli]MBK1781477.1 hypothetical protein [Advenella mandrilli]